jgi:hypothetical protein
MMKTNMLGMICVAAFSVLFTGTGHTTEWETKRIDYETHNGSSDLNEGVYNDIGDWKSWKFDAINGYYRYLSLEVSPLRTGIAFWYVKIPRTGFYRLKTAYFCTKHRTNDADYAVYKNVSETDARNRSVVPVYEISVNQQAENDDIAETRWVDLGVYCLKKNDLSMIVLDGRDDDQSDSADASDWIYIGGRYGSKVCADPAPTPSGSVNMAPINFLLLRDKK